MANEEPKEEIKRLAVELQKLLEENLPKDPSLTKEAVARAREIRDEIQQMGIRVTWEARIDPTNPKKIKVNVILWKPKPNMPPEDQKIYDEWFKKVNGIL